MTYAIHWEHHYVDAADQPRQEAAAFLDAAVVVEKAGAELFGQRAQMPLQMKLALCNICRSSLVDRQVPMIEQCRCLDSSQILFLLAADDSSRSAPAGSEPEAGRPGTRKRCRRLAVSFRAQQGPGAMS
jgi:hypothetical protein